MTRKTNSEERMRAHFKGTCACVNEGAEMWDWDKACRRAHGILARTKLAVLLAIIEETA